MHPGVHGPRVVAAALSLSATGALMAAEQAVDRVRRAAHRIVGLLAELACEGEVLPSLRQHVESENGEKRS
jgi:hypothetical protein